MSFRRSTVWYRSVYNLFHASSLLDAARIRIDTIVSPKPGQNENPTTSSIGFLSSRYQGDTSGTNELALILIEIFFHPGSDDLTIVTQGTKARSSSEGLDFAEKDRFICNRKCNHFLNHCRFRFALIASVLLEYRRRWLQCGTQPGT